MAINGHGPVAVKGVSAKKKKLSERKVQDRRGRLLRFRMLGYLRGCFTRGARYKLQVQFVRSFALTTGFSEKHIRRAFANFRSWTTEFEFERIRLGRSNQVKITLAGSVRSGVQMPEVTARLRGAISRCLQISGSAKIDGEFLRRFCELTRLPRESVECAWRKLGKFPGFSARWRGVGNGRKFSISKSTSLPQPFEGLSSATQRRDLKQRPADADRENGFEPIEERPSAGHVEEGKGTEGFGTTTAPDPKPLLKSPERSHSAPSFRPQLSSDKPVQVCGRWISGRKILAKAKWIAFTQLRPVHLECDRIEFTTPHALNFARHALRFGFATERIIAAYRAGCRQSHDDALDRDRLPGGGYAAQRKPSAAVAYAWRNLRAADPRSVDERWAEIFKAGKNFSPGPKEGGSGKICARELRPRNKGPNAENSAERSRLSRTEAAARLAELRARIAPTPAARSETVENSALTMTELAEYLRGLGMTVAEFSRFGYRERSGFIRRALAARGK